MKFNSRILITVVLVVIIALFTSKIASSQKIDITHSQSPIIEPENSISCNLNGVNYENSYYRRFDLFNEFRINEEWIVEKIVFGAAFARSDIGQQPVVMKFYSMPENSPLLLDSMTLLHRQEEIYYDVNSEKLVEYEIDGVVAIPRKHILVVEIMLPDGQTQGNQFFIASNALGQTAPSYIKAPECNLEVPSTIASIGYPDMHVIMVIKGEYASPIPEILSFEVDEQIGSSEIKNVPDYKINIRMPFDSNLTNIAPEIVVPAGFTIIPKSGEAVDFSQGIVTYEVTNELKKITQTWEVEVKKTDADILKFDIEGQIGDSRIDNNAHSIFIDMPVDTILNNLSPQISTWADFSVSPKSEIPQDFTESPVVYTVKHKNLDYFKEWKVYVNQEVTDVKEFDKIELTIYPNPAKDEIYVSPISYRNEQCRVEVIDSEGKLILLKNNQNIINISDLPVGIYYVRLFFGKQILATEKFIKQ